MSKLDPNALRHFDQANTSLNGLWVGGDPSKKEDFRELCWALLNLSAALREALDDIHSHVRQQSQAQSSAPPVPFIVNQR